MLFFHVCAFLNLFRRQHGRRNLRGAPHAGAGDDPGQKLRHPDPRSPQPHLGCHSRGVGRECPRHICVNNVKKVTATVFLSLRDVRQKCFLQILTIDVSLRLAVLLCHVSSKIFKKGVRVPARNETEATGVLVSAQPDHPLF